jgi:hypothetical protein
LPKRATGIKRIKFSSRALRAKIGYFRSLDVHLSEREDAAESFPAEIIEHRLVEFSFSLEKHERRDRLGSRESEQLVTSCLRYSSAVGFSAYSSRAVLSQKKEKAVSIT